MFRNKLVVIALVLLIVGFAACKKQTCKDVVCPANTLCVDGVCRIACDNNPYLVRDSCVVICGPNQFLARDTCWCDTNWIGNCDIPIGLLAGRYHVKGSNYTYMAGSGPVTGNFEYDITIIRKHDTLFCGGYPYKYDSNTGSSVYFTFAAHVSAPGYRQLRFRRALKDSVFYEMYNGAMGGGTRESFAGVKIQ